MNFLLKGLHWIAHEQLVSGDIRITGDKILTTGKGLMPILNETVIQFENHFLYPGLINAHDHLEMNLYPRLGHPPYPNYVAWGNDIYKPKQPPIKEIEQVDIETRLLWGGLKNLISGVTTVAHHNPWKKILVEKDFPVKVIYPAWAHSLAFGKNIDREFTKAKGAPFVIHAAEGTDVLAYGEIEKLNNLGALQNNTVLIHAIALAQKDFQMIASRNCSIVWCPASNDYLFQKTADIPELKKSVRIALGSDSTLTGSAVMLDEMRYAFQTGLTTSQEIFEMTTRRPAEIFNIEVPEISPGATADLMIAPQVHTDYYENLLQIQPSQIEAVFVNGIPGYGSEKIHDALKLRNAFRVQGERKYATLEVSRLLERLSKKPGEAILQSNPLWKMIAD